MGWGHPSTLESFWFFILEACVGFKEGPLQALLVLSWMLTNIEMHVFERDWTTCLRFVNHSRIDCSWIDTWLHTILQHVYDQNKIIESCLLTLYFLHVSVRLGRHIRSTYLITNKFWVFCTQGYNYFVRKLQLLVTLYPRLTQQWTTYSVACYVIRQKCVCV